MSKFRGTIPVPEFSIGDLVKVANGYGHIENIKIYFTETDVRVEYFILNNWRRANEILGELEMKLKKESK